MRSFVAAAASSSRIQVRPRSGWRIYLSSFVAFLSLGRLLSFVPSLISFATSLPFAVFFIFRSVFHLASIFRSVFHLSLRAWLQPCRIRHKIKRALPPEILLPPLTHTPFESVILSYFLNCHSSRSEESASLLCFCLSSRAKPRRPASRSCQRESHPIPTFRSVILSAPLREESRRTLAPPIPHQASAARLPDRAPFLCGPSSI